MRRRLLRATRIAAPLLLVALLIGAPIAWLVWERGDSYVRAGAARLERATGHFEHAIEAQREYAAGLPRGRADAKVAFERVRPVGERARAGILAGAEAVREETLEALTVAGSLPALPLGPRAAGARAAAARNATLYVEIAEAFEPLLDHLTFDQARATILADLFEYDPLADLGETPVSSPTEFLVRSAATAARHRETERQLLDLSPRPALISAHHRLATAVGSLAEKVLEARTAAERRDTAAAVRALADHRAGVAAAQQLALEQIATQANDPALGRSADTGLSLVRGAMAVHHDAIAASGPIESVAGANLPREIWAAMLGAAGLALLGTLVVLRRRIRTRPPIASPPTIVSPPTQPDAPTDEGWLARRLSWAPAAAAPVPHEPAADLNLAAGPVVMPVLRSVSPHVDLRVVGRRRELGIEWNGQLLRPTALSFGRRADFVAAFTAQLKHYREQERVLRVLHERGLREELPSTMIDATFVEPVQDPSFLSIAFPAVPAYSWRELPTRDVYAVVEACLIANDLGDVALRLSAMRPPLDTRAPAWVEPPELPARRGSSSLSS